MLIGLGYSQPLMKLMMFMHMFAHIVKGEEEIHKLLSEKSLVEPKNPQNPAGYAIEFVNVDFAYEDW
ncbi:hypothetical protein M1M88_00165 [Peptococcaceae bacterium]|nr:hypothetical protein [Peptococcaceae bacterium]